MTVTEHTALISARLVSSGAAAQFRAACGPTRSVRSGSSDQTGYAGADPTPNEVTASGVGVGVASMSGRCSQLVR